MSAHLLLLLLLLLLPLLLPGRFSLSLSPVLDYRLHIAFCCRLVRSSKHVLAKQSLFKVVMAFALHEILAPLVDSVPPPKGGTGAKAGSVLLGPDSGSGGDGGGGGGCAAAASKGKGKRRASREGGPDTTADSPSRVTASLDPEEAGQEDHDSDGHDDDDDDDDGVVEMLPGGEGAVEVVKDEDDVSIADLLASANRQAQVYANAPGVEDKKSGDAATMAFALQVKGFFSFSFRVFRTNDGLVFFCFRFFVFVLFRFLFFMAFFGRDIWRCGAMRCFCASLIPFPFSGSFFAFQDPFKTCLSFFLRHTTWN